MNTRKYSKAQEKKVASAIGGRPTPNSGAIKLFPGDVSVRGTLIECKTNIVPKKTITIKKEWLAKTKKEMISCGKTRYALAFSFEPDSDVYYIIEEKEFKKLIDGDNQ